MRRVWIQLSRIGRKESKEGRQSGREFKQSILRLHSKRWTRTEGLSWATTVKERTGREKAWGENRHNTTADRTSGTLMHAGPSRNLLASDSTFGKLSQLLSRTIWESSNRSQRRHIKKWTSNFIFPVLLAYPLWQIDEWKSFKQFRMCLTRIVKII